MKEKTMISLITILLFINLLSVDLYSHERFELSNSQSSQSTVRIIKKDSPLRLKPNSESLIIKKLPLGSEFPVVETIDGWIKIKLPPDKDGIEITGYINKSFVEFKINSPDEELKESPKKKLKWPSNQESESYSPLEEKLENAKAMRSTGLILSVAGSLVLGYGLYGTFNNPKIEWEWSVWGIPERKRKVRPGYLVADGVGFVTCIVGLAIYIPASGKVKRLKKLKEEKKIAYISPIVDPNKKKYGVQIRIAF